MQSAQARILSDRLTFYVSPSLDASLCLDISRAEPPMLFERLIPLRSYGFGVGLSAA